MKTPISYKLAWAWMIFLGLALVGVVVYNAIKEPFILIYPGILLGFVLTVVAIAEVDKWWR